MCHWIFTLLAFVLPYIAHAVNYDRAWSLKERTENKVTGLTVQAEWSDDGEALVYSLSPPHGASPTSWRINLETGSREAIGSDDPGANTLDWRAPEDSRSGPGSQDETEVRFVNQSTNAVTLYWVTGNGRRIKYADIQPGKRHPQETYAGHAWLITGTNKRAFASVVATSEPGTAVITDELCLAPPEPTPFAPPDNRRRRTSPDGQFEILLHRSEVATREVAMIDSSPDDHVQPRIVTHGYAKPGDELPQITLALLHTADDTRSDVESTLFPTPWSIGRFHWAPDSSECFFEYNQRGHQVYRVLALRPATGQVRTVLEESNDTFINYSNKIDARHLDPSNQILWMSERDGWNHLYVVDRKTGVPRQLTQGSWVVRGVDHVDEKVGQVWFRLMGMDEDQDPYHVHFARINLDGSGFTRLTDGNGTHALQYAPDRRFYIDSWSRVDQPPVHELRRSIDGALVCELGRADDTALRGAGWIPPEPFSAKGRDGETDIWGVIYRPTDFDPVKSYPVIESIYAGPHGQHVPKRFAAYRDTQALAELGFMVVQIDGMGTNWRSKAFHNVAWKNLRDAGFPDRIAWLKAAAETYPYLDLTRVGIYGDSAGGQNAMRAVLDHPDFYRAAVADCGCHDNRMDKRWWNEAWMGWPVDESYEQSSNVVDAHKLGGALLLTVGELDRNVDPASTMQVVDALIEADKDFELIVFPGKGHGTVAGRYGQRRMYEFFVRHLLSPDTEGLRQGRGNTSNIPVHL